MSTMKLRDLRPKQDYFWIDNEVIDDFAEQVGAYAIAVYTVLCRFSWLENGTVTTTTRQLAKRLKVSPQTISRSLAELAKHKLIHIDKKSTGLESGASVYSLLPVPKNKPPCSYRDAPVPIGNTVSEGNPVPIGNTNKDINQDKTNMSESESTPLLNGLDCTTVGERVFNYYIQKFQKNPKIYTFTDKRKKMFEARFKELRLKTNGNCENAEKLALLVVDALSESDFHNARGEFKGRSRYIEWRHMFDSPDRMEQWLERT